MGTGASKLGLVLLLASGCVTFDPIGPDDEPVPTVPPDGGGSGSTLEARRAFTQEVHPILTVMCSGCHSEGSGFGTPWYRQDPDKAYDVLTTTYAPGLLGEPRFSPDAPLITAPQETGQALYTPEQVERIFYWFDLESR